MGSYDSCGCWRGPWKVFWSERLGCSVRHRLRTSCQQHGVTNFRTFDEVVVGEEKTCYGAVNRIVDELVEEHSFAYNAKE